MNEILAVLLAVNMLLLAVMIAFFYKLNNDWSNLMNKMNADWLAWYKLTLGLRGKGRGGRTI